MSCCIRFAPPCGNSVGVADHHITGSSNYPGSILLCLIVVSCVPLIASAASDDAARPPVILISIDTLRADHLSSYGYTKIRTPNIDSFAETRFAAAEAQIPLTLPSHTSLFTSTYPFVNHVEENGERVPAGVVTLAGVLRSHGYRTAAFIGSDFMDRRYGLDQGFDVYDSPFDTALARGANPLSLTLRRDGALVERAARVWLDAHRGQQVFVFLHLFDLHYPYTLPPEVARRQGISRYDAQLAYVDQVLGRFQQVLKRGGWWEKSLVVVFSDHGEGLGDHQETDHGYYIYESTLHVPLLVHWPQKTETRNSKIETGNSAQAPSFDFRVSSSHDYLERVEAPVGLIDVAPTILDFLRVPIPTSFQGASQLGWLKTGEAGPPRAVYSESVYAHDAFRWAPLRALRVGQYKYIDAPKAELYNLESDPREQINLLNKNAAVAAELRNDLGKLQSRYAPPERAAPPAIPPETLAQLESLGYLAAEPRGRNAGCGGKAAGVAAMTEPCVTSEPDPKDRFAEFQLYQSAYLDFAEGRSAAAIPKLQSILNKDPQNTLARFHLGECYRNTKNPQTALREWVITLQLDPQYAPAAEAIGQYWMTQGDYTKARLRFAQVLALSPESYTGHFQLAVADKHLGLLAEAHEHLEIACRIAPHDENCARELKSLPPK